MSEIPPFKLLHHRGMKQITMRVSAQGEIEIRAPRWVPKSHIHSFVRSKSVWLLNQQAERLRHNYIDHNAYIGQYHQVVFEREMTARRPRIKNGTITVYLAEGEEISKSDIQAKALTYVKKALRLEAKNFLPERLDELARSANLEYGTLTLKDLRSRWGSCSNKRNINLNIRLMNLPSRLIDHVIYHELAHLRHMGHGSDFWKLLQILDQSSAINNQDLKMFDIRPTRMP